MEPGHPTMDGSMTASMACPTCAASITFDRRFTPWCTACEWNVDIGMLPGPTGRLARRRAAIARRLARRALRDVEGRIAHRPPRLTLATVAIGLICLAVLGLWTLLLVGGILLVLSGNPIGIAIGAVLCLVAVVSRPRLGAPPERAAAPETYRLLDDLSATMSAPRVARIGLDGDWNAGTYRFGLRQQHAIIFGLPLWHALSDPARIAILAHEVAHGVNGDTTRGVLQGTVLRTLAHWIALTEPDALADEADGFGGLMSLPGNVLLLAISMLFTAIGEALFVLSFTSSQRAELFADRLAAQQAGTAATIDALETLRHGPAYLRAVQRVALARAGASTELFAELRRQLASTPPSELERLRRQDARLPYRFDQEHPPLAERVALLGRAPAAMARDMPGLEDRMRIIDAEFATAESRIAGELVEEYLAALS